MIGTAVETKRENRRKSDATFPGRKPKADAEKKTEFGSETPVCNPRPKNITMESSPRMEIVSRKQGTTLKN